MIPIGGNKEIHEAAAEVASTPSAASAVADREMRELQSWERQAHERKRQLEELFATLDRSDPLAMQKLAVAQQLYALALARSERAVASVYRRQAQAKAERVIGELKVLRTPPDLQALVEAHGTWDQIAREAWEKFNADMVRWRDELLNIERDE